MSTQNTRVWFITGSSTGFCRILAEQLLEGGEIVVATARKPEQLEDLATTYLERFLAIRLDVTKPSEVREAVDRAIAQGLLQKGADTAIWLATEASRNETGKFERDRQEISY